MTTQGVSALRAVSGTIFDIQKMSIHDGPGIRTTVFTKGCPLRCVWCHNPESYVVRRQLSFTPTLCIGCGYCFRTCPHGAHVMRDDAHTILRDRCAACFDCTRECYSKALEIVGRDITAGEALDEVMKDKPFYEQSGGGLTLSGGEPMLQFAFTRALLTLAKEAGLHVCLETCGFADGAMYDAVLPLVDIFLFDCKETDPEKHRAFTGQDNAKILANLRRLDAAGARIVLRCPLIPGHNLRDDHLAGIARLSKELSRCEAVHVMGYHKLGSSKRERMGLPPENPSLAESESMSGADVEEVIRKLEALGAVHPRKS